MAYTTINKSTDHFNTVTFTGNNSTQNITGVGFQPDLVWTKRRNGTTNHLLYDSVRGVGYYLFPNLNNAQGGNGTSALTAFNADGFTLNSSDDANTSGATGVGWSWKAGGTAPSQTYVVKVVSDSGNKYRFDDFGTSAVTLDLQEGGVYTFDQSDSSNSNHPLRFSTTSNGTHGGGTEYTTGVVVTGTPGNAGAKTVITVAASAPTLYYYCTNHSGMGGQANTNSTFGSSNFSGSVQSTVSANTTSGFSIVKYTGNGSSGATIGHGLGVAPEVVLVKKYSSGDPWTMLHPNVQASKYMRLDSDTGEVNDDVFNNTRAGNNVFTVDSDGQVNGNGNSFVAYCFKKKKGFFTTGEFIGNGNADGPFLFCGFKPAFVIIKRKTATKDWFMFDNKTSPRNPTNAYLRLNTNGAEGSYDWIDLVSNGIKIRNTSDGANSNGNTYLFFAWGQSLVGSNNVPATAR